MKYRIEYNHIYQDFIDIWNIENNYLNPSSITSIEQTIKWNKKNRHIHIFIRDILKNKIIGEITILPLSKNQFHRFMLNELEDTEINEYTLLNFKSNSTYYLLFSTIAIDPKYKSDKRVLSLLLKGLNNKLHDLLNNGIQFLNMCAEGQTLEGQKFIEGFLDLKFNKFTKEGYKLYCFNSPNDFTKWLTNLSTYIETYNKNNNL